MVTSLKRAPLCLQETALLARYTPDLSKDTFHVALTKWHWVPQVVVGLVLLALGGVLAMRRR